MDLHDQNQKLSEHSTRPPVPGEECRSFEMSLNEKIQNSNWLMPHKSLDSFQHYKLQQRQNSQQQHLMKSSKSTQSLNGPEEDECRQWAQSLHNLLHSTEGTVLFLKFLEVEEAYHAKLLKFWLAVEGFRLQNNKKLTAQYLLRYFPTLPMENEQRKRISKQLKDLDDDDERLTHVFDETQRKVEQIINDSTYPNFLRSELYINYVQDHTVLDSYETEVTSNTDSPPIIFSEPDESGSVSLVPNFNTFLQTVHEDSVLETYSSAVGELKSDKKCSNRQDLISALHENRVVIGSQPKNDHFSHKRSMNLSSSYSYHMNNRHNTYPKQPHAIYNSYNPVSWQNSDTQSLCSHSDSDTQSVISRSSRGSNDARSKRQYEEILFHNERIVLNYDAKLDDPINHKRITDLLGKNMSKNRSKAGMVKHDADFAENLTKKLSEIDQGTKKINMNELMEKLNAVNVDENCQDILENHISRVFPESPSTGRRHRGKDKVAISTLSQISVDSGNECSTSYDPMQMLPKSKSMTNYDDRSESIEYFNNKKLSSHKAFFDSGIVCGASSGKSSHSYSASSYDSIDRNLVSKSKNSRKNQGSSTANKKRDRRIEGQIQAIPMTDPHGDYVNYQVVQALESEIYKLKSDLQFARNQESDLLNELNNCHSIEKSLRSEIGVLQRSRDDLLSRLSRENSVKQSLQNEFAILEKKLADEKKARIFAEQQLNAERKARKQEEYQRQL